MERWRSENLQAFVHQETSPRKEAHVNIKKNKNKSRKKTAQNKHDIQGQRTRVDIYPNKVLHCRYERKNNNNQSKWCQSRTMVKPFT